MRGFLCQVLFDFVACPGIIAKLRSDSNTSIRRSSGSRSSVHAYVHRHAIGSLLKINCFIDSFVSSSIIHSFFQSVSQSVIHTSMHAFIHSFVHSFIRLNIDDKYVLRRADRFRAGGAFRIVCYSRLLQPTEFFATAVGCAGVRPRPSTRH